MAIVFDASEIRPLTRQALNGLLISRDRSRRHSGRQDVCRRRVSRWPFPGTAELWVRDDSGIERHRLATCLDLSPSGIGVRVEEALELGTELEIAVHQPEASLHGRAVVRHCEPTSDGEHFVGLEFVFERRRSFGAQAITRSA